MQNNTFLCRVSLCIVFYCVFIFLLFSLFGYYSVNIWGCCCGQVNGVSLVSASHYQAVAAIKSAGSDMTMVVVKASASPVEERDESSDYNNTCNNNNNNNKFLLHQTSDEAAGVTTVGSDNAITSDKAGCDTDTVSADAVSANTVTQTVTGADVTAEPCSAVTSFTATSAAVDTESVSVSRSVVEESLPSAVTVNSLTPACRASSNEPCVSLNTEPYPVKVIS